MKIKNKHKASKIEEIDFDGYVYNLTINKKHNYCVSILNILTSNSDSMPDIDSDYMPHRRDAIKEYIFNAYPNKSASIGSYGKSRFRSLLQDIGRVYSIPLGDTLSVTKKLTSDVDDMNLDEARKTFGFLDNYLKKYSHFNIERAFNILHNSIRNVSKHAAGVIICNKNLNDQIPMVRSGDSIVTAWSDGDEKELSKMGFLKMDVLGLTAVSIISDTLKMIKDRHNLDIDIHNIDLNDKAAFELCNSSLLCGIFQFDTPVSRHQVKKIKPKSVMELSNITSLIRPGPLRMGMDKIYVENKKHDFPLVCKEVDEILEQSHGVILYQEQIMQILQAIGGFDLNEADTVRRILVKSSKGTIESIENNDDLLASEKKFLDNSVDYIKEKKSKELWAQMINFATYGFNKCIFENTYVYIYRQDMKGVYGCKIKDLFRRKTDIFVMSYKNNRFQPCLVKEVFKTGIKPVYKLSLKNKFFIQSTLDHKFLTKSGWVPLRRINIGDYVMTSKLTNAIGFSNNEVNQLNSDIFNQVESIQYTGDKQTYDIEVDDNTHNYVANHFVTHNSHSVAYALIGYQELWLKAHYPLEFYCALMRNTDITKERQSGDKEIVRYIKEMKTYGFEIYPPDVNISEKLFSIYKNGIIFGLSNIKSISKAASELINNRPFVSIQDIQDKCIKRIVNKRVIDALNYSGAARNINDFDIDYKEGLMKEAEYLKYNIRFTPNRSKIKNISISRFKGSGKYSGILSNVSELKTKKNDLMCRVNFEEIENTFIVWPSDYLHMKNKLGNNLHQYIDFECKTHGEDTIFITKVI